MIKVVIFDFDDTIYIGETWERWYDYIKDAFMFFLNDKKRYYEIEEKYNITKKTGSKEMVLIAQKEGIGADNMVEYISNHHYKHIDKLKTLSNEFFKKLSQHCSVYIVSMSVNNYILNNLKEFEIDKINFKGIFTMDLVDENKTKGEIYEIIKAKENVNPDEMLVIGDNYKNDILPAEERDMKCLHFNGDFDELYDYLEENSIMNCSYFKNKNSH